MNNFFIFIFVFVLSIAVIISFIYTMWRMNRDEQKLISIIHGSPIPTFVISKNHKVVYWNRALQAASKIKPSDVLGTDQHWRAFYTSPRPCLADLILDGKTAQIAELYPDRWSRSKLLEDAYEVTQFYPDMGEKGKWYRITSAGLKDSRGNLFGVMETLEDITEQKLAQDELLRRTKLESLGTFADGVAKDFDSLLTAILRNVFLAKISASDEDKMLENGLAVAERAGLQAKELAHRLITFAQGGYPVRKLEKIEPVLHEAAESVFKNSAITCNITIAEDLWPCEIDATQIKQVIENVLINAREAMPDGGSVQMTTENTTTGTNIRSLGQGNYIRIIIKDSGIGIPRENLPRIFDPYFTTKKTKEHGGIGLGLAISDSIIKYHNGLITVESIVNSGTTFSIYLPAKTTNGS
ncbi:MAG TPA: ATP-binding protein [Smithella sp.]|jgi:signal transduction histidine kinase|nr:PAS domain-containing protein [Smithella sp.]OQC52742.1 MAG: Sporulation kinase E [Deltaproteobacteria bacterium ADurb.Bin022]HNQ64376.1 ATP-binding protein [Smithella sp.]HOE32095.1 ATP-binding protein [Smithella sp.]HOG09878.1 ATP-binding protein [Smithella sp.]